MKSLYVVYWSGTGNTKMMAEAVLEGAKAGGAEAVLCEVGEAKLEDILKSDAVALGCPSMGCEVLEESEMEPFVSALEAKGLNGKQTALFGSYDWGDGQWMRDWSERMVSAGAKLVDEGLTVRNTPEEDGLSDCKSLGMKLATA